MKQNRWLALCLILALLCLSPAGVGAVSSAEGILYQNRFNRTLGGVETVKDSYSDTDAVVTGTLDTSAASALADDEPGVFRLEVKKDTKRVKGKAVKYFSSPIYTIGDSGTLRLEIKVFYNTISDDLGLFQLVTDEDQFIGRPLINLKPQLESATPWVIGDCNYNAVIPDSSDMTHAALEKEWKGKWHHFTVILQGNTYDIYHNGVKITQTPSEIPNASGKQIARLEHTLMRWGDTYALFDDFTVQTETAFCLQGSNAENGQTGVNPAVVRKVFDYNNFLDESTAETVKVYKGKEEITSEVSAAVDTLDKTRLIVDFSGALESGAAYRIDLSGIKDVSGALLTDNREICFTAGTAALPDVIEEYAAMDFETDEQTIAGGSVENGVWSAQLDAQLTDPKEIFAAVPLSGVAHNFLDPLDVTTLEMKIKTKTNRNVRQPFRFNSSDGSVIPSALLMNDGGVRLVGKGIGQRLVDEFQGDSWIHLYQVWSGNACDIYVNGKKVNDVPVITQRTGEIKEWNIYYMTWRSETLSLDDIRAQSLARLQIQKGDISDGAQELSVQPETYVFDFNNIIDENTLDNIVLCSGSQTINHTAEIDPADATRVLITTDMLEYGEQYELRFSGLKDIFGTEATDTVAFATTEGTGCAKIVSSNPYNGETGTAVDNTNITVKFDKNLDPATILPENITVQPPVPVKSAVLEENRKTVSISLGSNLLTNTAYSVSFSPNVKTLYGEGIFGVEEGQQVCFTTSSSADLIVNEFDILAAGRDGLVKVINSFYAVTDEQEKLEDKTRLSLGNKDYAALVFGIESGVRDFKLNYFDIDSESNGKGVIGLEMSADGEAYEPVTDTVSETVRNITDVGGYSGLYSISASLPQGVKYVRVSISRTPGNTANCWTPRLKNMMLNTLAPERQTSALIDSTPQNGAVNTDICKTLLLKFDLPFYACSVSAECFQVTDRNVESVYLSPDYRSVTLTLDKKLDYGKTYEVSVSNMLNQYGQPVSVTMSFSSKDAKVVLKGAALYNEQGKETELCSGTLTPMFRLENVTQEPRGAVIAAAVYNENKLESIRMNKLDNLQPGEQTVSLEPITVTETNGRTFKLFALESIESLAPLPSEGLGIVDTEYYPGFVRKAVTMSYDDGPKRSDITMMNMLAEYGLKATFNVNSDRVETNGQAIADEFFAAAVSHEIANHSKGHPNYYQVDLETAKNSITDGKRELEAILGTTVRGFAYPYNRPYGTSNEAPINQLLIGEGVAYARPSSTCGSFELPDDFLDWKFTCHHNNLENYKWDFYALPDTGRLQLLSVWGHSHEFNASSTSTPPREDTWNTILAPFIKELAERSGEIWNPTNIELVDYINAKNALVITEDSIYNPSDIDVYVTIDGVQTIIRPHQIVY